MFCEIEHKKREKENQGRNQKDIDESRQSRLAK